MAPCFSHIGHYLAISFTEMAILKYKGYDLQMTERADIVITTIPLPILQPSCGLFWQNITSPRPVSPPIASIWLPAAYGFSQS
jgi:hypothetical protein